MNYPVTIDKGGTGGVTRQQAVNSLANVAGATNEYVLTKDAATGNAVFKAASGGGGSSAMAAAILWMEAPGR